MLFFPEGTRSKDAKIKDFKAGAFKLAKDSGVALLPVALTGANDMIKPGSPIPKKAHLLIKILEPISAETVQNKTIDELMSESKEQISKEVQILKQKKSCKTILTALKLRDYEVTA